MALQQITSETFLRGRIKVIVLIQNNCKCFQNEVQINGQEVEGSQEGIHYKVKAVSPLFVTLSCPFNRSDMSKICHLGPNISFSRIKTRRLRISEYCMWVLICQPKAAEKARALENCFLHMYLFLDKCVCLKF